MKRNVNFRQSIMTTHLTQTQSRNFDYLKYLMSIFIILIHTGYSHLSYMIFLRIGVPAFFVLSSYFFFSKINASPECEHGKILRNMIKRTAKLYLFWFVVLLPVTIYRYRWFMMTFDEVAKKLIGGLFLNGTFAASWFLSALIIGTVIIYSLRRHNLPAMIISVSAYLLCCKASAYYFPEQDVIPFLRSWTGITPVAKEYCQIFLTFLSGLFYILCGKMFAYNGFMGRRKSVILTVIGLVALYAENYALLSIGTMRANDCMLSLMLLSPALVSMVANINTSVTLLSPTALRKASTIYYCFHLSLVIMIRFVLRTAPDYVILILVFTGCTILAWALIKLSQNPRFRILRYSY